MQINDKQIATNIIIVILIIISFFAVQQCSREHTQASELQTQKRAAESELEIYSNADTMIRKIEFLSEEELAAAVNLSDSNSNVERELSRAQGEVGKLLIPKYKGKLQNRIGVVQKSINLAKENRRQKEAEEERVRAERIAKEEAEKKAEEERKKQEEIAKKAEEERKKQELVSQQSANETKFNIGSNTNAQAQPSVTYQPRTYYSNCTVARAAGVTPIYQGQPGYAPHLDRDGDGIACER